MKEKYLGIKNRIFYRKNEFDSKRKTLVFVHGLSGSSSAWIPYEERFEKQFNVLTFDLRGHGKSFRPEKISDYSIEKCSSDLYSLVKHEKISKFVLIGHSFGNLVVLDFLKKHQKLVKSVIFISAEYAPSKRKLTRIVIPLLILSPILKLFGVKKEGSQVDYSKHIQTGDWNIKRTYADIKNTGLGSYLFATKYAYKFNAEKFLPKIKIPVLIIHGDKDTIFPIASGRKMHSMIKNSKMIVFNGADHIIPLNYFKRLSKEIDRFAK
jgi:3-oxoadipate enol-lactonase